MSSFPLAQVAGRAHPPDRAEGQHPIPQCKGTAKYKVDGASEFEIEIQGIRRWPAEIGRGERREGQLLVNSPECRPDGSLPLNGQQSR
jgi:hypothetical protein